MRVGDALARARSVLHNASDASWIVAAALGCDTAALIAHADDAIDVETAARVDSFVRRRAAGEPYAYIAGAAGFYGREFRVTPDVLIPRPETEHLIEDALDDLRGERNARIADIGTGSGAIAITLALELPQAQVVATDVSVAALAVARENARLLDATVDFLHSSLASELDGRFRAVLANLPYVPTTGIPVAPDPVSFEPRLALDGGDDGLDLYHALLAQLPRLLQPGALVLLEAAPPTMEGLFALAVEAFPRAEIAVRKDYADLERYVRVKQPL